MTQITTGVRAILSSPIIYNALQRIMGAHSGRKLLVEDFLRPQLGMNVLDIGCGPAEIIDYLPKVNYWGFDISNSYIAQANSRYGSKGNFFCKLISLEDLSNLPSFDLVLAIGLLHHLDDNSAMAMLNLAHRALKPGGRLITVDPCLEIDQNPIARYLIMKDRGQNVRTRSEYASLISSAFSEHRIDVRNKAWIPYTHCYMEGTRT